MTSPHFFRFSLRSLLLFVAVAAVACLWYRSHRSFERSPSKASHGGGYRIQGDPQHLRTRIFRDHDNRLVAILLLAFDELDASGPRYRLTHGYNAHDGGWLVLDDEEIEPRGKPRVFANGPFGPLVELDLTAAQAEELANCRSGGQIEAFYRQHVEPKLFRREGDSDDKGRQGVWTYRLPSGELCKEVTYVDGRRHGEMKTYYAGGQLKLEAFFQSGKPAGEWTFLGPKGNVLAVISRDATIPTGGGSGSSSHRVEGQLKSRRQARRWDSQIDDQHGYRLFVDGMELRLPQ